MQVERKNWTQTTVLVVDNVVGNTLFARAKASKGGTIMALSAIFLFRRPCLYLLSHLIAATYSKYPRGKTTVPVQLRYYHGHDKFSVDTKRRTGRFAVVVVRDGDVGR